MPPSPARCGSPSPALQGATPTQACRQGRKVEERLLPRTTHLQNIDLVVAVATRLERDLAKDVLSVRKRDDSQEDECCQRDRCPADCIAGSDCCPASRPRASTREPRCGVCESHGVPAYRHHRRWLWKLVCNASAARDRIPYVPAPDSVWTRPGFPRAPGPVAPMDCRECAMRRVACRPTRSMRTCARENGPSGPAKESEWTHRPSRS